MLARIAHDVYWAGRNLVRAEHTARMLDGLFHADLQGHLDDPARVRLSWASMLAIMGSTDRDGPNGSPQRDDVVRLLTSDRANPVSIFSCVTAAREASRTVRDTISDEMWEAINTFHLELERFDTGLPRPYSVYSLVKERSALFWGLCSRTMQKDDARAFLIAGGRIEGADMLLRMLRVALPPSADDESGSPERPDIPRRDGNALALLRAVGGFQAFMRAAAAPPNAGPVTHFLLYDRGFPDSVASSVESLEGALSAVELRPQDSEPLLRVRRVLADLDFRARLAADNDSLVPVLHPIQSELERVDSDIHGRYFHARTSDPRLLTG